MRCVALVTLALLAGACGVDAQSDAERVGDDAVPFELLAPPTVAEATTTTTSPDTTTVQLYFVLGNDLVEVDRELRPPVSIVRLVSELGRGPTDAEASLGMTTYLPEGSGLDGIRLAGGIATAELGEAFLAVPPEVQRLALAQLVYTITGRPGVGRVLFTIDGQPTDVPRGDGTLTSDSVSRDSYPIPVRSENVDTG